MTLYVYHFNYSTKEVEKATAEAEEKPKSYKVNGNLPFLGITKVLKDSMNVVYHDTYISEKDDQAKAVRAFRKYFVEKHRKAKAEMEKYDDFYRSCFKYTTPTGTVMVP